jgi:hypothetical protein
MAFICSFGKYGSKILAKTPIPKITKRRILVTRQALQDQPMQTNLDPRFLAKKSEVLNPKTKNLNKVIIKQTTNG